MISAGICAAVKTSKVPITVEAKTDITCESDQLWTWNFQALTVYQGRRSSYSCGMGKANFSILRSFSILFTIGIAPDIWVHLFLHFSFASPYPCNNTRHRLLPHNSTLVNLPPTSFLLPTRSYATSPTPVPPANTTPLTPQNRNEHHNHSRLHPHPPTPLPRPLPPTGRRRLSSLAQQAQTLFLLQDAGF